MKVLSFDPGGTTGFVVGTIDEDAGELSVSADQAVWTHSMLYAQLCMAFPDKIICESFEYRNRARKGLELVSCEYIGVIKLYSQSHNCELIMQTAAYGKGYYTDKHLKDEGLYREGMPHGMDALRHLLHWFTFGPGYKYNKKGFHLDIV